MLSTAQSQVHRTYKMSRSICILFVALATIQAILASAVEHRKVVHYDLTNAASRAAHLPDGEPTKCSPGSLTVGQQTPNDFIFPLDHQYENDRDGALALELHIQLPKGVKVNYITVTNKGGENVVFCDTPSSLGTDQAVMVIRMPPHSKPMISFRIGAH